MQPLTFKKECNLVFSVWFLVYCVFTAVHEEMFVMFCDGSVCLVVQSAFVFTVFPLFLCKHALDVFDCCVHIVRLLQHLVHDKYGAQVKMHL